MPERATTEGGSETTVIAEHTLLCIARSQSLSRSKTTASRNQATRHSPDKTQLRPATTENVEQLLFPESRPQKATAPARVMRMLHMQIPKTTKTPVSLCMTPSLLSASVPQEKIQADPRRLTD
jgi:hypothetical protein